MFVWVVYGYRCENHYIFSFTLGIAGWGMYIITQTWRSEFSLGEQTLSFHHISSRIEPCWCFYWNAIGSMSPAPCHLPLPVSHLFAYQRIFSKTETSVFCPARLKQQHVGFYGKPSPLLGGKAWLQVSPKTAALKPRQNGQRSHLCTGVSGYSLPASQTEVSPSPGPVVGLGS